MDIGVGLDATLGLTLGQQGELSQEAATLGYTSTVSYTHLRAHET